ncbi:type II secretion system secretin GspD [Methylophaga thalassica]|uniref:type II secretion system secretin GspD n=1 Tax=Methylophaga thalassica TaxID=40223 RepID=UPI0025489371|nr:type II secretion system secretin GspD [Methylophaga thalassica]
MIRLAAIVVSLIVLAGCQHLTGTKVQQPAKLAGNSVNTPVSTTPISQHITSSDDTKPLQKTVVYGDNPTSQIPRQQFSSNAEHNDITLNFEAVALADFVRVVLGEILAVNYSMDKNLTGQVTIQTPSPIAKEAVLPMLESVLAMNNARLMVNHDFYQVVASDQALSRTSGNTQSGYGVHVIPLRYISAAEMAKILMPYAGKDTDIQVDQKRNLVLLRGNQQDVQTLTQTISVFDVDWLAGMSVGIYPIKNASVNDIQRELETILLTAAADNNEPSANGPVRLMAINRLNSILAISANRASLLNVERWVERLDMASNLGKQQLYVYKVQNAKAKQLADVLAQVFGANIQQLADSKTEKQTLAPGETQVHLGSTQTTLNNPDQSLSASQANKARFLNDEVDIIADDVRNALVIMATAKDYDMIERTIKQLDTVPMQVLIEASIIEVTLSDELNFGVEWFFKNGIGSKQGNSQLDLGNSGINAKTPGFSFTVVDSLSNVRFALNTLAAQSKLNVLSSPSLMVLDNQPAKINVGDEIPIPTRQSVSNTDATAPTVNEIDFRKTGVSLTVLPRVNNSGLVTMEIRQEVSNAVQTTTSTIDAPTIQQREIQSVVAINSGETIVLGGLIQDSKTNNDSGVPGLHKLPVLGYLFGQTSDAVRRTELLVLITPRVIRDRTSAQAVTEELRNKMLTIEEIPASVSGKI